MRLCVITGSRADWGLLEWPVKLMEVDSYFQLDVLKIWESSSQSAFSIAEARFSNRPDMILVVGDRFEILAVATCAHLLRIPIAHIGGGDVTEGSYDDAMRDGISRMSAIHFVTSTSSMARLSQLGYHNVHFVGSPGIDFIRHGDWKKERPIEGPYVVVSYQAETIDGTIDLQAVHKAIDGRRAVWITPNQDKGSDLIPKGETYSHSEFLNLIYHCEEFIGNSSSMLYEAPELKVKTRMIGKRQKGRTIPWGDGYASERIIKVLKYGSY